MPSPRDMSPRSPHERVIGPRHLKKSLFLADKNLAVLPEDLTLVACNSEIVRISVHKAQRAQ